MPIYEYRCDACGFQKDHLQKMSDPSLTECPRCGAGSYNKQLTAAGFHLKGSGWYATDFKNNGQPAAKSNSSSDAPPPCQGGDGDCPCAPPEPDSKTKAKSATT